jgi:putative DNA primase/helicase
MTTSLLDVALHYAKQHGWSVHPVNTKKQPITAHGRNDATRDEQAIRRFFRNGAQIGVATGPESNLFALDIDLDEARGINGYETLEYLESIHGPLPKTPCQRTGRGGMQYLFRHIAGLKNTTGKIGAGVDTRGEGGYIVAAPSRNQNGPYTWVVSPDDCDLVDPPQWIIDALRETEKPQAASHAATGDERTYCVKMLGQAVARVAAAPDGQKHDVLLKMARWLGGFVPVLTEQEIESALFAAIEIRASDARNARKTIQDGIAYGKQAPLDVPKPKNDQRERQHINKATGEITEQRLAESRSEFCTDLGNARRLIAQHGNDIRFVQEWGWLVWNGLCWEIDQTGEIERRAKATVMSIYQEAADAPEHLRERLAKHAIGSQSAARIAAMIKLAESELAVRCVASDFDTHDWLLACANGLLDLKTGILGPPRRDFLLTRAIPVAYDPNARCPMFLDFLDRIFDGNDKLIAYIQRVIGYVLTGSTGGQCMFVLYGSGANGKSVLLNTLRAMLGDYARNAAPETFLQQQQERIRSDLARLAGCRLVSTVELDEGRRLSEALVKQITGGDVITARFLNKNEFEFTPRFKVLMATNHKPIIRGTDYAIWRRIRLIPFAITIPEAERDPLLTEKLTAELPGILTWALDGCMDWQTSGLQEPDEVHAATNAYRSEMDVIGLFLDDTCVFGAHMQVACAALYAAYTRWCEESGERPVTQRRFGGQMSERGIDRVRGGTPQVWSYIGVGLTTRD